MTIGAEVAVTGSKSPISFETQGGGSWKVWDRYIAIDGKRAFHIGNVCGTCSFFFERLDGANRSIGVADVVSELNAGISSATGPIVDALAQILPDGRYRPVLLRIAPKLVVPGSPGDYFAAEGVALFGLDPFWALPHHPRTEYYRLDALRVTRAEALYPFVVPTFPQSWLNPRQVETYRCLLRDGSAPTAVALGVLDVKQPAAGEEGAEVNSHWCFANYLLDGHHKLFAANQTRLPCSLLSFVALEKGIASAEQLEILLRVLDGGLTTADTGSWTSQE